MTQEGAVKQINACLTTASEKLGMENPKRSVKDGVLLYMIPYATAVEPGEFYQWFCSAWQGLEALYSAAEVKEGEMTTLVQEIIEKLQDMKENINRKLPAMCASYVLASLKPHPVAQTHALRLLIQMSYEFNLTDDPVFFKWIINIMKTYIVESVNIKHNRDRFVETIVNFFSRIKVYNHTSIGVLCTIFNLQKVKKLIKETDDLKLIAKNAVNSALNSTELFDFEVLANTKLIFDALDEPHKQILTIFVMNTVAEFELFLSHYPKFVEENGLDKQQMYLTIRMLTIISLVEGKPDVDLAEAERDTGLSGINFKRLVITLNQTGQTILKIDSRMENSRLVNKYSQPRRFDTAQVKELKIQLKAACEKLKEITLNPNYQ